MCFIRTMGGEDAGLRRAVCFWLKAQFFTFARDVVVFQPRLLMTPAPLVECGFKALRHPRIVVARVATWAGSAGCAAGAGVLAFPWSIGVAYAHPSAVLAE